MSLGNSFPTAWVRQSVIRQLKPGVVIKLKAVMDDGQLHEKRFIILHMAPDVVTCVINTDVPKFIAAKPHLARCQVEMDNVTHPFMTADTSHVDCTRVKTYSIDDVVDQLVGMGTTWILGTITVALGGDIQDALKQSPLISPADVAAYCASLAAAQLTP
jgi:hypothetical protein